MADYKQNLNQLLVASTCFMPQCMAEAERLGIEIYLALKLLAVSPGGVNYDLKAAKIAAAQWLHVLGKEQRQAISVYIDWQNSLSNGAQIPSPQNSNAKSLTQVVKGELAMGLEAQKNLLLYIKWRLNTLDQPL